MKVIKWTGSQNTHEAPIWVQNAWRNGKFNIHRDSLEIVNSGIHVYKGYYLCEMDDGKLHGYAKVSFNNGVWNVGPNIN